MARGDFLREVLASGVCPKCNTRSSTIDEQYSFGVYAGVMCTPCARASFTDEAGHGPDGQGSPSDLDDY